MKAIFLDIDGVLNSVGSFIWHNRLFKAGLTKDSTHGSLDPICCSNLQYVLEECGDVKIIISSTWRKFHTLGELQDKLKSAGLNIEIYGATPDSEERYRGKEIEAYLKLHPEITEFVILDDDSDMEPYMDRLVNTEGRNGFTFTDAEKTIEMLGVTNEKVHLI